VINLFILFVNRETRCVSFADPQFHTMLHKPRSGSVYNQTKQSNLYSFRCR